MNIRIGDEVHYVDDNGNIWMGTKFIVTSLSEDYAAGIDFGGEIYVYDNEDDVKHLQATGNHYDVIGALHQLRDS